jgi:glycosyltransferase involved in cell wall biosynthesis
MKIVQAVGWYYPDSAGGTEVYVAALCRRLRDAGHDVRVASPDAAGTSVRTYEHDGIPVYRYPIPARPTRDESQGTVTVRGTEQLHAWIAQFAPDVVHMHTFVTGLGMPELRVIKQLGARAIVTTHSSSLGFVCMRGTLMRWGTEPCDGVALPGKCAACALEGRGLARPLARAVASTPAGLARMSVRIPGSIGTALSMPDLVRRNLELQQELLALADRFVVLTDGARRILCANGLDDAKVRVNRLGVSFAANHAVPSAPPRPPRRPIVVGYVGRFDPVKGVEVLARAVSLLPPDAPLVVEFRGEVRSEAEARTLDRIRTLAGGDPRMRVASFVDHAQISSVLAAYDAICCPALCFEGGPTVALEAAAVGVPVIGSRIGGLAELVRDGVDGRLVPPGDAASLAEALTSVARDPTSTLDRWRLALARPRTMDEVAADYLAMYAGG